jgi:hypothetical protein
VPFMIPIFGAIGSALATAGSAIAPVLGTIGSAVATPFEALGIAGANTLGPALGAIGGGSALAGASTLGGLASTGLNIAGQVSQPSLSDIMGQISQGQQSGTSPSMTQSPTTGATSTTPAPLGQQQQQQFLANASGQLATSQGQMGGSLSPGYADQLTNQLFSQNYGGGVPDQNQLVNQAVSQFFGQGA